MTNEVIDLRSPRADNAEADGGRPRKRARWQLPSGVSDAIDLCADGEYYQNS